MPESKAASYDSFEGAMSAHESKHWVGRRRENKKTNPHGEPSSDNNNVGGTPGSLRQGG